MIKRSQRCRRCEHNLSKPEYNPTSIKFKIQLAAYYHVPELVIYKVDKLVAGVQAKFVIKVGARFKTLLYTYNFFPGGKPHQYGD